LEFRALLKFLALLFQRREFNSGSVQVALLQALARSPKLDLNSLKMASSKRVSNDLGRLYRMGFLRRRAAVRRVRTRTGKTCNRGREWSYSISRQGWSYLVHMSDDKLKRLERRIDERFEDEDMLVKVLVKGSRAEEMKPAELGSWEREKVKMVISGSGGYRRFPPRVDYAEHRAVLAKKNYLLRKSKADKKALAKYAKEAMGLVEKDLISVVKENLDLRRKIRELEVKSRKLGELEVEKARLTAEKRALQNKNAQLVAKLKETAGLLEGCITYGKKLEELARARR